MESAVVISTGGCEIIDPSSKIPSSTHAIFDQENGDVLGHDNNLSEREDEMDVILNHFDEQENLSVKTAKDIQDFTSNIAQTAETRAQSFENHNDLANAARVYVEAIAQYPSSLGDSTIICEMNLELGRLLALQDLDYVAVYRAAAIRLTNATVNHQKYEEAELLFCKAIQDLEKLDRVTQAFFRYKYGLMLQTVGRHSEAMRHFHLTFIIVVECNLPGVEFEDLLTHMQASGNAVRVRQFGDEQARNWVRVLTIQFQVLLLVRKSQSSFKHSHVFYELVPKLGRQPWDYADFITLLTLEILLCSSDIGNKASLDVVVNTYGDTRTPRDCGNKDAVYLSLVLKILLIVDKRADRLMEEARELLEEATRKGDANCEWKDVSNLLDLTAQHSKKPSFQPPSAQWPSIVPGILALAEERRSTTTLRSSIKTSTTTTTRSSGRTTSTSGSNRYGVTLRSSDLLGYSISEYAALEKF